MKKNTGVLCVALDALGCKLNQAETEALEEKFIKEATKEGLDGLRGHRSVGGCRASIYNAMPVEGVKALVNFMKYFMEKNG